MEGNSGRKQYRMEERRKLKARKQERQANKQNTTTTPSMEINERTPRTSDDEEEQEEGNLSSATHDDEENDPMLSSEKSSSSEILSPSHRLSKNRGRKSLPAVYDDGETVELEANLTPTTYSLIYVCDPKSFAFLLSIFLFAVQTSLPALVMVDLIDSESEDNPLRLPVDVSRWVRMAGYIALVLSIPAFEDLLDAIERLHEGYHVVVMKQSPHATFWKWLLAFTLQLLSGMLLQSVIFILIVQADTVIGMLMNFAALAFLGHIDDIVFSLADRGYFTDSMKEACNDVKEHKTPTSKGPWVRRLVLLFFVVVVVFGYTWVMYWQRQGRYLCDRLEVQFGDGFWSALPMYSGIYLVEQYREGGRLVYKHKDTGRAIFRFCREEEAWVFGVLDFPNCPDDIDDCYDNVCKTWWSRSPTTNDYDILATPNSEWVVNTTAVNDESHDGLYQVDHFVLRCQDCSSHSNSNNGTCFCDEGYYGENCQFDTPPCDSLNYDHRTEAFAPTGSNSTYASQFDLIRDQDGNFVTLNGRAAYAHIYPEDDNRYGLEDLLVFLGRRYYLLQNNWTELFPNDTAETIGASLVSYFEALEADYDYENEQLFLPDFVSDPIDIGTPMDALDPVGLRWNRVDYLESAVAIGPSVGTLLLCETCFYDHYCYNGKCTFPDDSNSGGGFCECEAGQEGPRCEA